MRTPTVRKFDAIAGNVTARWHIVASATFLAAVLAIFGDVLLAGDRLVLSIPGDDLTRPLFYIFRLSFDELRKGHLMLWNPYNYAGIPHFGAFGPALLYPPNWLYMVLPTAFAINLAVALHLVLAGLWVYCWTLHRRLHPAACILAGLVFMFSGAVFLQIYRGHLHCLTTLVWAPLIFLAIDGVLDTASPHDAPADGGRRRVRWVLLGAAAVALQIFAGHVQYVFYTAIIAGGYALACWVAFDRRARDAAALLAIYPVGACLAAVQLFTGLQAASESFRIGISYDVASSFAFPPENLVTLILPGIFGDMTTTTYWGRWSLTEMSLFIGVAPFVLAMYGVGVGDRRFTRFSLVTAAIVMILAFGDYTPLFHVLYDYVPGFGSFRGTTKFIYLAELFMVMLVAIGCDRMVRTGVPRGLAIATLVVGGVLAVAGFVLTADCHAGGGKVWRPALSSMRFLDDAYRDFVQERAPTWLPACVNVGRSLWIAAGTSGLVGALLLAARRRPQLVYAVAAIGVIEVMAYARYSRPTFDPRSLPERSAQLRRLLDERGVGDARFASEDPYSYVGFGARAYDLWGAEPAVLNRYARFLAVTQNWPVDAIVVTSGLRHMSPLLGMLRLRYLLHVDRASERMTLQPSGLKELPRALLVPRWRVVTDAERALDALRDPAFDPEGVVVLERDPGLVPVASDERGQVSIDDISTEVIEITADVPQPSILLITDNFSVSWKATPLAGSARKSYDVIPGDYLLRAIPLSAGHHHLRLAYRPSALPVGIWVTVITLAASAALLLISRPRAPDRHAYDAAAPPARFP